MIIIQVVGFKNSGKTTLVCKLIEELTHCGIRVGTVKHDAHDFEIDQAGKDTWLHKSAGATRVAIVSGQKAALMIQQSCDLVEMLRFMQDTDIVLVEGFKHEDFPKIVMAPNAEDMVLARKLRNVIGIATWHKDLEGFYDQWRVICSDDVRAIIDEFIGIKVGGTQV